MVNRRVVLALVFACVSLVARVVEAQEMAARFYVVPRQVVTVTIPFPDGSGSRQETFTRPKYVRAFITETPQTSPDLIAPHITSWSSMDYGRDNTYLLGANVTPEQHTQLAAALDVIAIPLNLDSEVGLTALDTVKTRLESLRVPAGWVTTSHTYRQVVGAVARIFLIMQRFSGRERKSFFEVGITLDTRMNQLTVTQRDAFRNAILDLGTSVGVVMDLSAVVNTTTIREVLRLAMLQLPSIELFGQVF
jgi:hypothetical protein